MGGDYAPDAIVQRALWAYAELRVNVTLVGDQNLIWKQLREQLSLLWEGLEVWNGQPLGIKGVGVICHGSSSPKAIKNAIRTARNSVSRHVRERLEQGLATVQSDGGQTN